MTAAGFTLAGEDHPISPVMLWDEQLNQEFARRMLAEGQSCQRYFAKFSHDLEKAPPSYHNRFSV